MSAFTAAEINEALDLVDVARRDKELGHPSVSAMFLATALAAFAEGTFRDPDGYLAGLREFMVARARPEEEADQRARRLREATDPEFFYPEAVRYW